MTRFQDIFNQLFRDGIQLDCEDDNDFVIQVLSQMTKSGDQLFRYVTKNQYMIKKIIGLPFRINSRDMITKYIIIKWNHLTSNNRDIIMIDLTTNGEMFKCQSRNPIISLFTVSGRFDEKFELGLSNSPKDCLALVNNDIKFCRATDLIKACLIICYYFGIWKINLGDTAGIGCLYDNVIKTPLCGDNQELKNIPVSMLFRIINKPGFYEGLGADFIVFTRENYDMMFSLLRNCPVSSLFELPEKKIENIDLNQLNIEFVETFGDMPLTWTIGQFFSNYVSKKLVLIDRKKSCQVIEIYV